MSVLKQEDLHPSTKPMLQGGSLFSLNFQCNKFECLHYPEDHYRHFRIKEHRPSSGLHKVFFMISRGLFHMYLAVSSCHHYWLPKSCEWVRQMKRSFPVVNTYRVRGWESVEVLRCKTTKESYLCLKKRKKRKKKEKTHKAQNRSIQR